MDYITELAFNEEAVRHKTISFSNWYIDYEIVSNETALVIPGADGIGVFFLILNNNHIKDFEKVIEEYKGFNKDIDGLLGECIRYACASEDIVPERCTIGGFYSKLKVK